jgi:hypothetical protein
MNHAASESRHIRLVISIAIVLAVAFLIALLLALLGPAPPRTVVMATGAEGGAYHQFGERYRALLKRQGVELKLVTTDGAVDNVQRLRDARSGVSVAFVQGGVTSEQESPELVSLGTVFYEPGPGDIRLGDASPHLCALWRAQVPGGGDRVARHRQAAG